MKKLPFVLLVTFVSLLMARTVYAQELITNGTFDTDLDGWEVEVHDPETVWGDSDDHTGNSGGSVYLMDWEGCIGQDIFSFSGYGEITIVLWAKSTDESEAPFHYYVVEDSEMIATDAVHDTFDTWRVVNVGPISVDPVSELWFGVCSMYTYVIVDDISIGFSNLSTESCPYGYIPKGDGCVAYMPLNDQWHINTDTPEVGLTSGELPAPLPVMPAPAELPALQLPYVNHASWPTTADEREVIKILVRNRANLLRQSLTTRYDAARLSVRSVRNTTNMVSALVGNPMETVAHTGERSLTLTAMAQEAAQSVTFALDYARAVADIGPMGLDLVFVFMGLGWLVFVNAITLLVRTMAWFIRMIGKVLEGIWKLLMVLLEFIRLIVALIDLFWPF